MCGVGCCVCMCMVCMVNVCDMCVCAYVVNVTCSIYMVYVYVHGVNLCVWYVHCVCVHDVWCMVCAVYLCGMYLCDVCVVWCVLLRSVCLCVSVVEVGIEIRSN